MQTGKDGCDLVKFSAVFNYLQWAWWHTDCAFGTCWVFGEWKKGRCHMSCPDLCALGKLYPGLTFPLCHLWLTSSSHAPLNKQPFSALHCPSPCLLAVTATHSSVFSTHPELRGHIGVVKSEWEVTLLKNTCDNNVFGIMGVGCDYVC